MKETMPPNMPTALEQEIAPAAKRDETKSEKEPGGFDLEVYVTDHSPDNQDTGDPEKLRELYGDVARDGVDRVRFDFHWGKLENQRGQFVQELFTRYKNAKNIQEGVGLKVPIIILSNPPEWAKKLYKEGKKEEFFEAFRKYAEEVVKALASAGGERITTVQVFNELNNKMYTPVDITDMPRLCQITREVFGEYNSDLKLMATVNANNLSKFVGTDAKEFLPELKKIKDSFDRIAIDNYPGTWHLALNKGWWQDLDFSRWPPTKGVFKKLVKQLDYLKDIMEEVAAWGVDYEIGEAGMPSKLPWGGEKSQRYFYDAFFRALKQLLIDFRNRGIRLPSAIGLYEAQDEPTPNMIAKFLDRFTPYPEARFGMRAGDGRRKEILQGRRHQAKAGDIQPENFARWQRSQLRANIDYLRSPTTKATK
jgi:hypothetical protein